MKMTLLEAKECLSREDCRGCKFFDMYKGDNTWCSQSANDIGVMAINYLIVGNRLYDEAEGKER